MRHSVLAFVGGGVVALIFVLGAGVEVQRRASAPPTPPHAVRPSADALPTPRPLLPQGPGGELVLLARDDESDGTWEELLAVQAGGVRSLPVPSGVDRRTFPVTDGTRVYFRAREAQEDGQSGFQIVARDLGGGEPEVITGSTPLVLPRGLFASPNGRVIAFYLDNTEKQLTELWTYQPEASRKRLALERLSADAVGPFWMPDGGFLVRDGAHILQGSPHRTGATLLPIDRGWDDVPQGNTMIPSPGGTQVVFVTHERGRARTGTSSIRVWDVSEGRERGVLEAPEMPVEFLGWSADGALLAVAGTKTRTLWELKKGGQTSFPLGADVTAPVLSSNGTAFAFVRAARSAPHKLVILDAVTRRELRRVTLPAGEHDSFPRRGAGASSPFHVLQFVRQGGPSEDAPTGAHADLAAEGIVRYVTDHVREMADAPPAEPVTAERVWLTRIPDVVLVDYRVGTELWRRMIRLDGAGGVPTGHEVLAVYAPAAGEWVRTRGQEVAGATPEILYEFEHALGQWVQREAPIDIQP